MTKRERDNSGEEVELPHAKKQKMQWSAAQTDELFFWLWDRIQRDGAELLQVNYPASCKKWKKEDILKIAREHCAASFELLDQGKIRDLAALESLPFDRLEQGGVWYCAILKDSAVPQWYKLYTGKHSNY